MNVAVGGGFFPDGCTNVPYDKPWTGIIDLWLIWKNFEKRHLKKWTWLKNYVKQVAGHRCALFGKRNANGILHGSERPGTIPRCRSTTSESIVCRKKKSYSLCSYRFLLLIVVGRIYSKYSHDYFFFCALNTFYRFIGTVCNRCLEEILAYTSPARFVPKKEITKQWWVLLLIKYLPIKFFPNTNRG